MIKKYNSKFSWSTLLSNPSKSIFMSWWEELMDENIDGILEFKPDKQKKFYAMGMLGVEKLGVDLVSTPHFVIEVDGDRIFIFKESGFLVGLAVKE